jgi:hypothetical protein
MGMCEAYDAEWNRFGRAGPCPTHGEIGEEAAPYAGESCVLIMALEVP